MDFRIEPYSPDLKAKIVSLSLRAWERVFAEMEPAVPGYVYKAFYPLGWQTRQAADIEAILDAEGSVVRVAVTDDAVLGWVGIRLHQEDKMGEIYILAVDPGQQRQGIGSALMSEAFEIMREAGMEIAMVETGDDPGHAPSRATYESAGFERWPVARYFRKL